MADGRTTRCKETYYFRDLTGQRFGKLVALYVSGTNKYGNKLWVCRCDCGNTKEVASGKLVSGRATNCGCFTTNIKSKAASRHGITAGGKPRTLTIWNGMKQRCYNPKSISYKSYGGRGIRICDEWLGVDGFKHFHEWAISNGYGDNLEIDRIDNDGDYCPENCHWIPANENHAKQRSARYFSIDGKRLNISQWCKELKISKYTAYKKINESEDSFIELLKSRIGQRANLFH